MHWRDGIQSEINLLKRESARLENDLLMRSHTYSPLDQARIEERATCVNALVSDLCRILEECW